MGKTITKDAELIIEVKDEDEKKEEKAAEPMTIENLATEFAQLKDLVTRTLQTKTEEKEEEETETEEKSDCEKAIEELKAEIEKLKKPKKEAQESSGRSLTDEEREERRRRRHKEIYGKEPPNVPRGRGKLDKPAEKKEEEKTEETEKKENVTVELTKEDIMKILLKDKPVEKRGIVPQEPKEIKSPLDFTYEELLKGDPEALMKKAGFVKNEI